ncbi:cytochrome P450 [Cellulomonas sp. ATA003]|uniref:cytochrome P450 n=1 Tax=Cellulomonas sp. ATA003 TaxID=3073064 RepID=UPI0028730C96|nr:cytochrome P450 [Cellulomonas sp. ATA003]WNB84734.1 cytochrome P450 [Cellulomonas sp. ATA003]
MTLTGGLDSTLAFAWQGYEFVSRRCERQGTDVFQTRLLLEPTVCLRGADAARIFYDDARLERRGAMPLRVQKTLVGVGGVQGLDGQVHRARKQMFMGLMSPQGISALTRLTAECWQAQIPAWERAGHVVLYEEVGQVLYRAVSTWAGVPFTERQVKGRTDDLHAMIDGPAAVGPRHWRSRRARRRAEISLARLVEAVRTGEHVAARDGSALTAVATHRDPDGHLLDSRTAAVELLNLLRPTVAVDRFITFAALALHQHPQWRTRLRDGDDHDAELFVQEVRRFYPFFPVAAARVRSAFDWRGVHFPAGGRVLLDLYGTNHHPRLWEDPETFRPERFATWDGGAYDFIPQGGGNHHSGHRCPGEWITIAVMKTALAMLTRHMRYDVPAQDLRISHRRMPTLPASGLVISSVQHPS